MRHDMPPQYPSVEFQWQSHNFQNENGAVPAVELDWNVTFLEGRMVGCDEIVSDLADIVHTQERRLVKHTEPRSDGSTMLGDHHLTARFQNWNVFYVDHPAVEVLWQFVKEGYERFMSLHNTSLPVPLSIQSWANVLRKGDDIGSHAHASEPSEAVASTNFCVTADESTATVYDLPGYPNRTAAFTNQPGQLIVFPPWVPHHTTPFKKDDSTRITIASDIVMNDWYKHSFEDGQRTNHFLPLDTPPSVKLRRDQENTEWGDVEGVDGTIAQIVNHNGELAEDDIMKIIETGSDYADEVLTADAEYDVP